MKCERGALSKVTHFKGKKCESNGLLINSLKRNEGLFV